MIKIVYIDDEANTEGMESKFEMMRDFDLEVIAVTDIESAIPALRSIGKVGAIVIDLIMPPHSVYTLGETNGGTSTGLRLLRDICSEFSTVPVIIVSVMRDAERRARDAGLSAARFITKPVDYSDLARQILEAIGEAP